MRITLLILCALMISACNPTGTTNTTDQTVNESFLRKNPWRLAVDRDGTRYDCLTTPQIYQFGSDSMHTWEVGLGWLRTVPYYVSDEVLNGKLFSSYSPWYNLDFVAPCTLSMEYKGEVRKYVSCSPNCLSRTIE